MNILQKAVLAGLLTLITSMFLCACSHYMGYTPNPYEAMMMNLILYGFITVVLEVKGQ